MSVTWQCIWAWLPWGCVSERPVSKLGWLTMLVAAIILVSVIQDSAAVTTQAIVEALPLHHDLTQYRLPGPSCSRLQGLMYRYVLAGAGKQPSIVPVCVPWGSAAGSSPGMAAAKGVVAARNG